MGIETTKPRLSWTVVSDRRGASQTSYQILLSDSLASLEKDQAKIWDSGRVESSQTTNIECDLSSSVQSGKKYWWKVRVWDENGRASDYGQIASFEMGLLKESDWYGVWIGGGDLLRRTFETEKRKIVRARAYVCGLGYYELSINGIRIGDRVLTPAWTDYSKRVLYDTYDVSESLISGEENTIGLFLGKGRYPPAKEQDMSVAGYGPPRALLQLNIEYEKSGVQNIFTSASWEASGGPIVSSDIFVGEDYDARLEKPGWDKPKYRGQDFREIKTFDPPGGRLVSSALLPPIRVVGSMQTRQILCPSPGVYVYDFGQNFSGWTKLHVRGPRGAKVTLRYSEIISADGNINPRTNERAESTDHYTLKGEGLEEYEPRFTYHGFRYVEMTGFPGAPSSESLEGRVVHSDVQSTGGFICSNALINRIQENIRWGQLSNLMGIPTDCPQRNERMGWLGDAMFSSEEAVLNFWMPTFYEKWLVDIRDTQDSEGSISSVAPAFWKRNPAEPSHGMAYIMIPFEIYRYYRDIRVLSEHYDSMKKYVEFLNGKSNNFILDTLGQYGDYCEPSHLSPKETPWEFVSTCMFHVEVVTLAKIAKILQESGDEKKYLELASNIRSALNSRFLKKQWDRTKDFFLECYGDTQALNALPLGVGMVPDDKKKEVIESLVLNIVRQYDGHLDTGMVATKYLFPVLSESGYADLAFEVATKEDYPGFGYMVRQGATTVWERWENRTTYILSSHNHIMLGSIGAWFYSALAGIYVDETAPGFRHFTIKPEMPKGLESASGSIQTISGLISSSWRKEGDRVFLKVAVPANCTSTVHVPTKGFRDIILSENDSPIFEGGKRSASLPAGVDSVSEEDDHLVCHTGSGNYSFVLAGRRMENSN